MSPMNVDDIYALTPMQRLMLVHALMSPGPGVLANQVCYEIDGNLRTDAFRRAWEALVTRHAALRTAILWDGLEQPVQVVRTHVEVPFVEVDLANHPAEVRSARVEELKSRDRQAAFDLTRAPLMRCTLIRLGEDRHYFIWNIHHLVVDRWSHGTLFADLRALYAALIVGDAAELAPPVEFRDYVAWLAQQEEGTAERFWREELGGFGESTTLATKTPPAGEEGRLLTRHLVATETTAGLEAQAATWKTTLAAIVLAGVGLETSRLTGSTDVVFGLTVSGRPPGLDRVEHAVGSFVSNVPLRFQVEAKRPLAECVRAVQLAQIRRQPFEPRFARDHQGLDRAPAEPGPVRYARRPQLGPTRGRPLAGCQVEARCSDARRRVSAGLGRDEGRGPYRAQPRARRRLPGRDGTSRRSGTHARCLRRRHSAVGRRRCPPPPRALRGQCGASPPSSRPTPRSRTAGYGTRGPEGVDLGHLGRGVGRRGSRSGRRLLRAGRDLSPGGPDLHPAGATDRPDAAPLHPHRREHDSSFARRTGRARGANRSRCRDTLDGDEACTLYNSWYRRERGRSFSPGPGARSGAPLFRPGIPRTRREGRGLGLHRDDR